MKRKWVTLLPVCTRFHAEFTNPPPMSGQATSSNILLPRDKGRWRGISFSSRVQNFTPVAPCKRIGKFRFLLCLDRIDRGQLIREARRVPSLLRLGAKHWSFGWKETRPRFQASIPKLGHASVPRFPTSSRWAKNRIVAEISTKKFNYKRKRNFARKIGKFDRRSISSSNFFLV